MEDIFPPSCGPKDFDTDLQTGFMASEVGPFVLCAPLSIRLSFSMFFCSLP